MSAAPRLSLPVAVIMGRRMVARSGWRVPSWRVVGVVAGDSLPGPESNALPVHQDEDEEHFLWGGMRLDLYRDATEAYWSNLMGQRVLSVHESLSVPRLEALSTRLMLPFKMPRRG